MKLLVKGADKVEGIPEREVRAFAEKAARMFQMMGACAPGTQVRFKSFWGESFACELVGENTILVTVSDRLKA